jgi:hypothetical protein
MADKLTKEEVQATLLGHLTKFSEKIAEVVDDHENFCKETPNEQMKLAFAFACMKDVATLTGVLTGFVHETLVAAGIETDPPPQKVSEADVIELDAYRNNGGLLN